MERIAINDLPQRVEKYEHDGGDNADSNVVVDARAKGFKERRCHNSWNRQA